MIEIREKYRNKDMGKSPVLNLGKLLPNPENYLISGKAG